MRIIRTASLKNNSSAFEASFVSAGFIFNPRRALKLTVSRLRRRVLLSALCPVMRDRYSLRRLIRVPCAECRFYQVRNYNRYASAGAKLPYGAILCCACCPFYTKHRTVHIPVFSSADR